MIGAPSGMSCCVDRSVLRGPVTDSNVPSRQFEDATLETTNAAKCNLAGQVLRSFGTLRLRVTGSSMIPSLWPGDLFFFNVKDICVIYTGDIVLFARHGRLFAHRVVSSAGERDNEQMVTQGDALCVPDPPVTSAELLGRVSLVLRAGKWTPPRAELSPSGHLLAALVSRSSRAAGLLVRLRSVRRIQREQEAPCES